VGVPSGAGCNELIKRGALLCDSPQDIIDFYGKEVKEKSVSLTETEKSVLSVLKDGEMHIEKICLALSKQIFEITPLTSILEMKGLIYKSGNVYGLARNDLEV
jgi:predicted Rossmann fold nucleotide-binding protein DprA/Smf involved in DNA uptake